MQITVDLNKGSPSPLTILEPMIKEPLQAYHSIAQNLRLFSNQHILESQND